MKKEYLSLPVHKKQWVKENRNLILTGVSKFGITEETVRECYARVLKRYDTISEPIIIEEAEAEMEKSRKRQNSREAAMSFKKPLTIYNGYVINKIMENDNVLKKSLDDLSKGESVTFYDSSMAIKAIRWKQRLQMCAICTVLSSNIDDCDELSINVNAREVYELINPKGDYWKDKDEFIYSLNDTIDKFQLIEGVYKWNKNEVREFPINKDFFFDCVMKFDEKSGDGMFGKSVFMSLCEAQRRLFTIDKKYLKGKTLDEQYVYSFLYFCHECRYTKGYATSIDRRNMRKKLGAVLFDKLGLEKDRIMNGYLRNMKPLFHNSKADCVTGKITWEIIKDSDYDKPLSTNKRKRKIADKHEEDDNLDEGYYDQFFANPPTQE